MLNCKKEGLKVIKITRVRFRLQKKCVLNCVSTAIKMVLNEEK